jgi:hypothetical protein
MAARRSLKLGECVAVIVCHPYIARAIDGNSLRLREAAADVKVPPLGEIVGVAAGVATGVMVKLAVATALVT